MNFSGQTDWSNFSEKEKTINRKYSLISWFALQYVQNKISVEEQFRESIKYGKQNGNRKIHLKLSENNAYY